MKILNNSLKLVECPIHECNHSNEGYCHKKKINLKCNVCIDNTLYVNEVNSLKDLISKDIDNYKFRKEQSLKNFANHNGLEVRFNKVLSSLDDLNGFLEALIDKD